MLDNILISIKPKWCSKILNKEKTIEIRKTKPKLDPPFKVYIYCTMDSNLYKDGDYWVDSTTEPGFYQGRVIASFICNKIHNITNNSGDFTVDNDRALTNDIAKRSCVSRGEMIDYLKSKTAAYAWEISSLTIFDKPILLQEFIHNVDGSRSCCDIPTSNKFGYSNCEFCMYFEHGNGYNVEDDCNFPFDDLVVQPFFKPPQSWAYCKYIGTSLNRQL